MKLSEKLSYLLGKSLLIIRELKTIDKNHIFLVADHVKPRVAKIGYALREKGFKVTLLLDRKNKGEIHYSDFKFYDYLLCFSNKEELYCICLIYRPLVYHIFSEAAVMPWTEYLIQNKCHLGKIVYDQYDVYRDLSGDENNDIIKREKYCMENADGLCCRMFETQYLKHKYHYKFKGKRILFLDYCWNKYKINYSQDKQSPHLKLIYGGRLIPLNCNNPRAKIEWEGLQYIADTLRTNKDYFVVVPSRSCEEKGFRSYRNLKFGNPYFILKEPMSFKKLIRYESHMDYGIDCLELQSKMDEYEIKLGNKVDLKSKMKYYATNKYFDYLDAGIPALYGRKDELFGRYLARYGGAISCSLEELSIKMDELRRDRQKNKKNAVIAREKFAIEKQINRLINFYNEL